MIEYLYNAIRAAAGQNITLSAEITDNNGEDITEDCQLHIFNDKEMIIEVDGIYQDGEWTFPVSGEATKGLYGRYFYCIGHKESSLCFKQPIYFK
jgi:hypothetical protein